MTTTSKIGGWTFTVPGPPVAKQRPRMNRTTGAVYTPTRTKDHERDVYYSMLAAGVKLQPGRMYGVYIEFYLSAMAGDIDNLAKTVLDGMFPRVTGEADDRQVYNLQVHIGSVQDAREERTVVTISDRGPMHEWARDSERERLSESIPALIARLREGPPTPEWRITRTFPFKPTVVLTGTDYGERGEALTDDDVEREAG